MARLGRAMDDRNRARILISLLDEPGYPGAIAESLELTRANVSNHLACLRGCGLVHAHEEGRRTRYELADRHVTQALGMLLDAVLAVEDGTLCDRDACDLQCCVDHEATLAGARA